MTVRICDKWTNNFFSSLKYLLTKIEQLEDPLSGHGPITDPSTKIKLKCVNLITKCHLTGVETTSKTLYLTAFPQFQKANKAWQLRRGWAKQRLL